MPRVDRLDSGVSTRTAAGFAATTLLSAVLFYFACRNLVPSGWPRPFGPAYEIGRLGDVLPSFAHSYAFSIWLALAHGRRTDGALRLIIAWAIVESTLEVAQLGSLPVAPRPTVDLALVLFSDASRLLSSGTFDIRDIAAIWAGVFSAAMTLGIHPGLRVGKHAIPAHRAQGDLTTATSASAESPLTAKDTPCTKIEVLPRSTAVTTPVESTVATSESLLPQSKS